MLHASTRARERERQVRRLALTRPKRTAPASLVWFVKWFGVQTSEIVGEGADTQAHKHHGANGPCSCLVIFVPKTIFQWFTTPMIERGKTHKPKLVQNSQQAWSHWAIRPKKRAHHVKGSAQKWDHLDQKADQPKHSHRFLSRLALCT